MDAFTLVENLRDDRSIPFSEKERIMMSFLVEKMDMSQQRASVFIKESFVKWSDFQNFLKVFPDKVSRYFRNALNRHSFPSIKEMKKKIDEERKKVSSNYTPQEIEKMIDFSTKALPEIPSDLEGKIKSNIANTVNESEDADISKYWVGTDFFAKWLLLFLIWSFITSSFGVAFASMGLIPYYPLLVVMGSQLAENLINKTYLKGY